MENRIYYYARVSTKEQNLDRQILALQKYVEPKNIVIPSDPEYKARIAFGRGPLGEEIEFFLLR